eukprot:TRINITY_DN23323_c0_g1_i1.p1 TRINITY_DN23323_c0_g1~~TRINITY_DN23323_c0_g1_i1.p1  ORF type:complete len:210 (-),score=32.48 TRINITY_DN23323_c0_g1_i1:140-769(-)
MAVDPADEFYSPYTYCASNPANIVDPDGKVAILATRALKGIWGIGGNHSFIVLIPDNPEDFTDYNLIDVSGPKGISKGMIIGAYNEETKFGNKLIAKQNQYDDYDAETWNSGAVLNTYILEPPGPVQDTNFLKDIIGSAKKYSNDRDYTPFSYEYYVKKGKGNCHNFTTGTLMGAGVTKEFFDNIEPEKVDPGLGTPLPEQLEGENKKQ